MNVNVIWNKKLFFTGKGETGFSLPLDSNPAVGGENKGFEPMELIAIGLAGCTGMDTISILQKKRQDVTGFEVKVHTERAADYPKVFTHITVEYVVEGHNIDPVAVERSIELSVTKYCPAEAMFRKVCQIDHTYSIKTASISKRELKFPEIG